MLEYVATLSFTDVTGAVAETVRNTGTFLREHMLVTAAIAVCALLLFRWTTARR